MSAPVTPEFEFIRDMVRDRAAIVLDAGKVYLVESRLTGLAAKHGIKSLRDLVRTLRAEPFGALHRSVVEAMTTNETSFYRDIHPFEALQRTILPEVIAKRSKDRSLTIWCAAASSGQEPYSIAMLLREHAPQLARWEIRILATDINRQILERAKEGKYSPLEVARGLPSAYLTKYFVKVGAEWQVKEDLRKMVEFREMNLAAEWPLLPSVDVLFIRNVLIYFDVEMKRRILGRCRRVLRAGGYLFLGSAETTISIDEHFERLQFEKAACYRVR